MIDSSSLYTSESFIQSAENESTYFLTFNHLCASYGKETIYCFVENYDQFFYPHRVQDITGRKAESIPCDGKKNVIKTFSLISSKPEYSEYHTRYFVDADFDDNSTLDKHIYITPCYSIENFYVDSSVVGKILETEYHIRRVENKDKFNAAIEVYNRELEKFHNCVLLFNAWYRTVKRKGLAKENNVNLDDSFPTGMITVEINNIKQNYTLDDICDRFPDAPSVTDQEVNDNIDYLRQDFGRLRGKYEIQFLDVFFQFLNKDAKDKRLFTIFKKGVSIDRKRIISNFDHYVDTPADMREYIINGER